MNWKNYFPKGQKEVEKSAKCVSEFTYMEDSNLQNRQKMEDFHFCIDGFTFENTGLFAIFDGHGGQDVAKFCKDKLPQLQNQVDLAFKSSYHKLDQQLKLTGCGDIGSTACVIFIDKGPTQTSLTVSNVGDSRCIMVSNPVQRLSVDHKPNNPNEASRLQNSGFNVFNDRLNGTLAVTRAFGDWNLKNKGLICDPELKKIEVKKGAIIVIASDGLWDVVQDQECFEMISNMQNTEEMAKNLLFTAINRGSKDNISCLVLKI